MKKVNFWMICLLGVFLVGCSEIVEDKALQDKLVQQETQVKNYHLTLKSNQDFFAFLLSKLATYKKALYKQGLNHLFLLRKYILLLRNKHDQVRYKYGHCNLYCLMNDKCVYQISYLRQHEC